MKILLLLALVSCASSKPCPDEPISLCKARNKCVNKAALLLGAFGSGNNQSVAQTNYCIEQDLRVQEANYNLKLINNAQNHLKEFALHEDLIQRSLKDLDSHTLIASCLSQNVVINQLLSSPVESFDKTFLYKALSRNSEILSILSGN